MIGDCELDLADFVKPDKYLKQMTLQNIKMNASPKSFITVEIRTSNGSAGSPTKSKVDPRQSVLSKASTATSK